MRMTLSDDPLVDFARYDAEQQEEMARLPVCECCGDPIQQEKAVCYDGKWWCSHCEEDFYQHIRWDFLESVDDYGG